MSSKVMYVDLLMNNNQLLQAVLQKENGLPAVGPEGQIIYNQLDDQVYVSDGISWQVVGNVQDIVGTAPIVINSASGTYTISITNATIGAAGAMSAADKTKLDALNQIDDDTDVPHSPTGNDVISGVNVFEALGDLDTWAYTHTGSGIPDSNTPHNELKINQLNTDINLGNSDTLVSSQRAIKTYVDSLISSSGRPTVPFDATQGGAQNLPLSYDTPNTIGGVTDILTGDQFIISVAGTVGVGNIPVNPNDTLIAGADMTADDAATQVDANWSIIAAATVQSASETVEGIAFIATQIEANAGADTLKFITPATMHGFTDQGSFTIPRTQNGSGASITVNHNFNNRAVAVACYNAGTGEEMVGQITRTLSSVTVNLNAVPGFTWEVVVIGEDLT